MTETAQSTQPIPAHIPHDLVRDFDFLDFEGVNDDPQLAWRQVQERMPDVFWTPRNGGHWIATRMADIRAIMEDHERFSNSESFIPIRPGVLRILPVQLDPPEHNGLRKLIMPAFLPRALVGIEDEARTLAIELIEGFAARGECEFVSDFAGAMPLLVFLNMMGLPVEDRPYLRETLHHTQRVDKAEGFKRFNDYLESWIAQRRENPADDLISKVVHGVVDGRPITPEEASGVCLNLLTGGLDTVVSMMAHIARYLATHPEARRRLAESPVSAQDLEELIRRHGVTNLARQVSADTNYNGLELRKGEQVLIPQALPGLDDRVTEHPERVDFERPAVRHLAFGAGVHTCPGASLARRELRIFLEEWFKRIPEFTLKQGVAPLLHAGTVNTISELWLSWDPADVTTVR